MWYARTKQYKRTIKRERKGKKEERNLLTLTRDAFVTAEETTGKAGKMGGGLVLLWGGIRVGVRSMLPHGPGRNDERGEQLKKEREEEEKEKEEEEEEEEGKEERKVKRMTMRSRE